MTNPIHGQPLQPSQHSQPVSQAKPKTGPEEVSNSMLKNADTLKQMHTKGRFILGAGEPASYDKALKNSGEAELTAKVFNRAIGA